MNITNLYVAAKSKIFSNKSFKVYIARTLCTALLLLLLSASAATITVDDSGGADNTTIQAAVDNATAGDTIYVYNGSYEENVDEQLTLRGEGADVVDVTEHTANYNAPDATEALQLAPLNPDFVAYQKSSLETSSSYSFGYIPPPMDLSHLDDIPVKRLRALGVLPDSFDWRELCI